MFRVFAFLAFSLCGLAANYPVREVTSQAALAGNQPIPAFYKGYVYWAGLVGDDHQITIYAPDGHLAFAFPTQNGSVQSIAIDADGSLAVAWFSKKGAGIEFRDSSGAVRRTVETGWYVPAQIAFAEDHSLWTFGWQFDEKRKRSDRLDYMTVRKYHPDGQQAGAYLPRSLFPPGLEPAPENWQRSSSITVAHDRVGLWSYSGMSGNETEWVELDLNGNLMSRRRLDQFKRATNVAFTTDGHVFVQTRDMESNAYRLYALDRASAEWKEVEEPPPGWMIGADGDSLAFSGHDHGPMHIRWYEHP